MEKRGYEQVPDIESGDRKVIISEYSDLEPNQQKLFLDLDDAIAFSDLQFATPELDLSDVVERGQSFFVSIVSPTAVALLQVALAFYIENEEKIHDISESMVVIFPYLGALLQFVVSIRPTQKRIIDTTSPVFGQIDAGADRVNSYMAGLQPHVDTMVAFLRQETRAILEPIEPTLVNANKIEFMLKRIDPEVDIPETKDVDKIFDKVQAGVAFKIKEAQSKMDLRQYIPPSLKSPQAFYWKIIFPILCVAFLVQMVGAFVSQTFFHALLTPSQLIDSESINEHLESVKSEIAGEIREIDSNIGEYKEELRTLSIESRHLLISVAVSYFISLVQLLICTLVTNKENRKRLIKRVVDHLTFSAHEYLQQTGVTTLYRDMLGANMERVKIKVLRAIRAENRLKLLISKVGGDNAVFAAETAQNSKKEKVGIFQKIFGGRK